MRAAAWAIAISTVFHAAAFAWVGTRDRVKPVAVRRLTPPPEAQPAPEPPELAVVLLDDHAPLLAVAPPTRDKPAVSHPRASHGRISVSTGPRPEARSPGSPPELPAAPGTGHSPLMSMRGSERAHGPELSGGPSADFLGQFVANDKPLERGPAPTGELHPNGREMTSRHETFTAHVERDGTAHFETAPDVDVKPSCLFIGCKMAFDDALMRRAHIDPYASAKRQWLEKTFDERVAMGIAFRKDELAHSAIYMQRNLDWMWRSTSDPRERKQALFELWDEVAETGGDELVAGGAQARAYLVGFIRTHLPAGSAGAFSDSEVAQLNAHRKSHAVFAPYAPDP
jgi:hypothetical protein